MEQLLKDILINEKNSVMKLLQLLEAQHDFLINNKVYELDNCIKDIEECNKEIAQWEYKRRSLVKDQSMRLLIQNTKDSELESEYREMVKLIEETRFQQGTNEMLIKQGLVFYNKMLNLLNPDKSAKTYNSYGKVKK